MVFCLELVVEGTVADVDADEVLAVFLERFARLLVVDAVALLLDAADAEDDAAAAFDEEYKYYEV